MLPRKLGMGAYTGIVLYQMLMILNDRYIKFLGDRLNHTLICPKCKKPSIKIERGLYRCGECKIKMSVVYGDMPDPAAKQLIIENENK